MLPATAMSMFQVVDYSPTEGDQGVKLQLRTRVAQTQTRVFLRLVVGQIAIATEIYDEGYDSVWRLEGNMPPFHNTRAVSSLVTLTVQAVNQENLVLDEKVVGNFQYLNIPTMPTSSPHSHTHSPEGRSRVSSVSSSFSANLSSPALGIPLSMATSAAATARRGSIASVTSTVPSSPASQRRPASIAQNRRVLRRREQSEVSENLGGRVVIEFATPIESLGQNLTEEERILGRRLVQFECELYGSHLSVTGKAIRQEDYREDEAGITISCIYRSGTATTHFTSVDVIQLLQYFANERFKVEEKNRIRRNLEGFHPTTISKTRANLESFFAQIMEFPTPKPRNIEKDVKVFNWENLGPAVDKIMSKYSVLEDRVASESPLLYTLPDSGGGLGLSLPQYHDLGTPMYESAMLANNNSLSYTPSYHATPQFESGSSHGSDSEHEYSFHASSPSLSTHPENGGYASPTPPQPQMYSGSVNSAYDFGGALEYGHSRPVRAAPTQYTM